MEDVYRVYQAFRNKEAAIPHRSIKTGKINGILCFRRIIDKVFIFWRVKLIKS